MKTARTQTATRSMVVWKKPLNTKQPSRTIATTKPMRMPRSIVMGREMNTMRAMPTIAVSSMQRVEVSSKVRFRNRDATIATKSEETIETEAGAALRRTFARKLPVTRSRLGSSARMNDGIPMMAVEMSVIWMGMKGYGGMTMQMKVRSIV